MGIDDDSGLYVDLPDMKWMSWQKSCGCDEAWEGECHRFFEEHKNRMARAVDGKSIK
jgi:hypothetical protein